MASRNNQSLQIVVIVLSLVVILCFVGLILLNNARKTAVARADQASSRAAEQEQVANGAQQDANELKVWMGFQEADNKETIKQQFDEDMARFGSTFDENNRFYRTLLENIYEENRKLAQSEGGAKQEVLDLKKSLLATEQQKDEQIAQYRETKEKVESEAAKARNEFTEQKKQIDKAKDEIAAQLAEQRQKIDAIEATSATEQSALNDKIAKLERVVEILQSNQVEPDPFAQPADGLIRYVNQRDQTVWINLGEADNLRPQVTFSVYDGDESDALGAERKGNIEVTQILSANMAEARITDSQATRPLMTGDKIYSQVWNRGRQVGFAIAGIIDFDDDGRSDLDQLRQIIALNNGKVDAVPGEDGSVEGEMTVDTRYLILGKHPADTRQDKERAAWEKMSAEADTLGVEAITLDEFLSLMGWQPEQRTVTLGAAARYQDFPAVPQTDYKPPKTDPKGNLFRTRKPQPTY